MKISISHNLPQLKAAMEESAKQAQFAIKESLNKTLNQMKSDIQTEMQKAFDRPTPWVMNSLRIKYANKTDLTSYIGFKDKNSADWQGEATRTMLFPNVEGGNRVFKAMEVRLLKIGLIPNGYNVVPGEAAALNSYGNMSPGQISQILNVLGSYTESGFNKANLATRKRLAKGNAKKNIQGFVYWVNPVGNKGQGKHLQPGVYKRVMTATGKTELKPVLIFVKRAKYKNRLDFYAIAQKTIDKEFKGNFDSAFEAAMRTAIIKQ